MIPAMSDLALKEWDATIAAVAAGRQTILLRKGGLLDDGASFALRGDQFFLYPTFYHAAEHLLTPGNEHLARRDDAEMSEDVVTKSNAKPPPTRCGC